MSAAPVAASREVAAQIDPAILRAKLKEFLGENITCLNAINQPLVSDMQECIRLQHAQLQQCASALLWVLGNIKRVDEVRYYLGAGTQTYHVLTAALAEIENLPVDQVRDSFLPGSSAMHAGKEKA